MDSGIFGVVLFVVIVAAVAAAAHFAEQNGFQRGAIAAYKRQIVCAEVPQLNRAAEWQCKELER